MKSTKICALVMGVMLTFAGATTSVSAATQSQNNATGVVVNTTVKASIINEWKENSKYVVGDKVTYQGKIYECTVDHSRLKPTTKYVWKQIGEVKFPQWQPNTKYTVGTRVMYEGNIYECTVDHSRLLPTTKYVWKLIVE